LTGRGNSKKKELPPYSRQLNGSTGWNGMFRHLSNLVQPRNRNGEGNRLRLSNATIFSPK
jgi:hypothetical protein